MTSVSHATFISGLSTAFVVASGVAVAGALIALLTKRGREAAEGAASHAGVL